MKEIKIQIPEGYEGIDEEKSNLAEGKIVFKKKESTPWRKTKHNITGYYIGNNSSVVQVGTNYGCTNICSDDKNIFATKKQAKSILAMAQLSQIIQNDQRFGGPLTDMEWIDHGMRKYFIDRCENQITTNDFQICNFRFLAFHTARQRDLFLEENEDLIRQYYMLD